MQSWWRATFGNGALRRAPEFVRILAYGIGGGAAAIAFQSGIVRLYGSTYGRFSQMSPRLFIAGSLVTIVVSSLAVGWLLNAFCREASGSGIPELRAAFWKDFGFVPWRVGWVKFLAGVLSIGGGSSLGREGPSAQLAGAVGSSIAGRMGKPKQSRRLGAVAGAAAGLAGAFNTPLAAVTFVLEEIVQDLNSRLLGGILLASVLGAFVAYELVGRHPAFLLAPAEASGWSVYALVPLVAAAATVVGVLFQWVTLRLRKSCLRGPLSRIPPVLRPLCGGLITWGLGIAVFLHTGRLGVFGLGYQDLSDGLTSQLDWRIAGVLLAAKLVATAACYGFGGCGGIFTPTLFFGAMSGLWLVGLLVPEGSLGLGSADRVVLGVVGMSACMGAIVRAPITSILIVFEMTHEYTLVPPLMLGTLVSQGIARLLQKQNFYDAILEQDGHAVQQVRPPRDLQSWQQWPVSSIANFRPVCLRSGAAEGERQRLLRDHPYQCFPTVESGRATGVVTRAEIKAALSAARPLRPFTPTVCAPDDTIRSVQWKLVESPVGLVLLVSPADGELLGLLTLHDLLRAEMAMADSDPEE